MFFCRVVHSCSSVVWESLSSKYHVSLSIPSCLNISLGSLRRLGVTGGRVIISVVVLFVCGAAFMGFLLSLFLGVIVTP